MQSNNLNVIDLFSGAGGFSKGFELAGFNVILGIDNWEKAKKTYESNHENAQFLLNDIRKVSANDILETIGNKEIDVIIGGPPCQGFSLSGKRSSDDVRNNLIFEFSRIVNDLQPKYFVMENVEGLLSLDNGAFLKKLMDEFKYNGYKNIDYKVLNSADYGIPQIRKRVFLIGNRIKNEIEFPEAKYDKNNYVTFKEATNDLPSLSKNLNLKGSELKYSSNISNEYQAKMRKNSTIVHNHQGTKHWDKTINMISLVPEGGNWKDIPEKYRKEEKFNARYTRFHGDKPTTTVDTGHRHHFHNKENRVPTVRENARRQSFPDDFIFYGTKTSQYRQVGNAVPTLLAKEIAEVIKKKLNNEL